VLSLPFSKGFQTAEVGLFNISVGLKCDLIHYNDSYKFGHT